MKSKTTTAVLLSLLAVAGLAVNDAYAQSNTDRLISIDENAESIKDTVEGIADDTDALSTMVSAIQDTLSGMADTLTNIMNAITGVQTSVDSVAMDVTQMNSKIVGIETTLMGLSGLDDRLASIDSRINNLASGGMNDQILHVLTSTVTNTNDRLENVIDKLDAIEDALERVNIRVESIETTPAAPRPGNILLEGESELNINTYHYLKHGDATTNRGTDFYELDMTFSCNKDVFIDKAELVLVPDNDYMARGDTASTAVTTDSGFSTWANVDNNYVTVNKRDLYNNKLPLGGANYAVYHSVADFNNYAVEAGDRLVFESLLYEGKFDNSTGNTNGDWVAQADALGAGVGYLVDGSTRDDDGNRGLYEINVEWFSYESGTSCSIGFGSSSSVAPGLTRSTTLSYGVTQDPAQVAAERTLRDFSDTIDCGGDPVEITDITAGTGDDWRLPGFAKVDLTIGSDEYALEFDTDDQLTSPVFANLDEVLPLYIGNQDLVISGSVPLENFLITLHYDTIPDAECVPVPGY